MRNSILGFAFSGMLCFAPLPFSECGALAAAQLGGFVREGDYFPQAREAMTLVEQAAFKDAQAALDAMAHHNRDGYVSHANRSWLLSVKISQQGNVLVNLKRDIPRGHSEGLYEYFYQSLRWEFIKALEIRRLGYLPEHYNADTSPIAVYFVFNGMTVPVQHLPPNYVEWFVPRFPSERTWYDDFVRHGDYFDDATKPMNAFERQLFSDVRRMLRRASKTKPTAIDYVPGLSEASLISVKVSKRGGILVNLKKGMPSLPVDGADTDFYFMFEQGIDWTVRKMFRIPDWTEPGKESPVLMVYFVFEGWARLPALYRPAVPSTP